MIHARSFNQMTGLGLAALMAGSCATSPTPVPTATSVAPTVTSAPPTPQLTATVAPPTATPTPATPTEDRTPLPPPIAAEFPTGTFFHQHTGPLSGTYCVFQFNEDGTFAYFYLTSSVNVENITSLLTGTYQIDGNLYTETTATLTRENPGISDCPGTATYAWTFDGQTLEFQVVGGDPCPDRLRTYESPLKYTKVESGPSFPPGTYVAESISATLKLADDGRFTFSESGTVVATGTYSIQGNEITWETDTYCERVGAAKATYVCSFKDDTLLFQVKGDDRCADRLRVLNDVPYRKEE
jgi:hypothetical protein